jgi:hypothetical protein
MTQQQDITWEGFKHQVGWATEHTEEKQEGMQ